MIAVDVADLNHGFHLAVLLIYVAPTVVVLCKVQNACILGESPIKIRACIPN